MIISNTLTFTILKWPIEDLCTSLMLWPWHWLVTLHGEGGVLSRAGLVWVRWHVEGPLSKPWKWLTDAFQFRNPCRSGNSSKFGELNGPFIIKHLECSTDVFPSWNSSRMPSATCCFSSRFLCYFSLPAACSRPLKQVTPAHSHSFPCTPFDGSPAIIDFHLLTREELLLHFCGVFVN